MSSLLSALFQGFLSWIQNWFEAERAEADAWARRSLEGQKESLKRGKADEAALQTAADTAVPPATPADWNR